MERTRQKRIVSLCIIFIILFMPLVWRLSQLQIVNGAELARMALRQQTLDVALEEVQRGNFYDRKFRSLTDSGYRLRVIVFPQIMVEKSVAISRLSAILPEAAEVIKQRLEKENKPMILPVLLSGEAAAKINSARLTGVVVAPVRYRYGEEAVAANLVGHLGKISSQQELKFLQRQAGRKDYRLTDWVGKAGLEKYYEVALKGTRPERVVRAYLDARNQLISGLGIKQITLDKDQKRQNVVLTIDADVQKASEDLLRKHQVAGAIVVMDVSTGDLLALASSPTYDQRKVSKYIQLSQSQPGYDKVFYDRTILLTHPGSVFKVVVAAAALEAGIVTPRSKFKCVPTYDFFCDVPTKDQIHDLTEAVAWSCNATFVRLGEKLGASAIIKTAENFGLGSQKVIGYPFSPDGLQNWENLKEPYALVNGSIGQGSVLVNPIQVTAMMNVVANQGIYIQPRLVREMISSAGGLTRIYPLGKSYRAVSYDTAQDLKEMLAEVTLAGTGKDAWVDEWGSAGKTGTAQIDKDTGLLYAWFSGFTPLEKPKYAITILVEDGVSGGKSAAPIFKELAEFLKTTGVSPEA